MYAVSKGIHIRQQSSISAIAWIGGVFVTAMLIGGAGCNEIPDGAAIEADLVFGDVGLSYGQFSYPRGIDANERGVVVVDKSARVQRFDVETGAYLGGFRMPAWDLGKPTGLTLGPSLHDASTEMLYVADTHYHRIAVFPVPADATADAKTITEPVLSFGVYGEGPGEFVYVTDVALLLDESGAVERVYVSEYGGNDRISVFEPTADGVSFLYSFGIFGDGPGTVGTRDVQFERPQAMAIDYTTRELIVLDNCNHRVGRFTLEGELITWIGDDTDEAQFLHPQGLVLLEGQRAMIAEFLGNRVQVIDLATGASLGSYGYAGRGEGELASPWGVALAGRDAFVLDSGNNRVQRFRAPGRSAPTPEKVMADSGGTP